MVVEPPEGFDIVVSIPCEKLEYNLPGTSYVALSLPESVLACTGTSFLVLRFFSVLIQNGRSRSLQCYTEVHCQRLRSQHWSARLG